MTVGGVEAARITGPVVEDSTEFIAALSYKPGQFALAIDGNIVGEVTSYSDPMPDLAALHVGQSSAGTQQWFGTIANLRIFDRAYTPAQLQEMSA